VNGEWESSLFSRRDKISVAADEIRWEKEMSGNPVGVQYG